MTAVTNTIFRGAFTVTVGMALAPVLTGGMGRCNHATHGIRKSICNPRPRLIGLLALFELRPLPTLLEISM